MLLTDPPYGVSYVGKTAEAKTIENDDLDPDALEVFMDERMKVAMKYGEPGAAVYMATPGGPLNEIFQRVLNRLGILRQTLIWVKDSMVMGRSDYHYKHEPILYGWIPGAAHRAVSDRTKTTVWEFARPKKSEQHPTMKPVPLFAEAILNSTLKGELVFDMFLGSGTTIIAAEETGRIACGCEISPHYAQLIVERYRRYCSEKSKPFECYINGVALSDIESTAQETIRHPSRVKQGKDKTSKRSKRKSSRSEEDAEDVELENDDVFSQQWEEDVEEATL